MVNHRAFSDKILKPVPCFIKRYSFALADFIADSVADIVLPAVRSLRKGNAGADTAFVSVHLLPALFNVSNQFRHNPVSGKRRIFIFASHRRISFRNNKLIHHKYRLFILNIQLKIFRKLFVKMYLRGVFYCFCPQQYFFIIDLKRHKKSPYFYGDFFFDGEA